MVAQIYGKSLLLDKLAITSICTDACRIGAASYYEDDWFYANWVIHFPFANNEGNNAKNIKEEDSCSRDILTPNTLSFPGT
jgi:hypothetical protein